MDDIYKKIGEELWSIFPDDAVEIYFYVNLAENYKISSSSFLLNNGEEGWYSVNEEHYPSQVYDNVYSLLKKLNKNQTFKKEPWTQALVTLTEKGNIDIKFAYIDGEDSWPGLEMIGISELTQEEAYEKYSVPKEEWEKRQKFKKYLK